MTVDDGRPEAEAIAVSKDRIQALGTAAEIKSMIGPNTQVIDLQGQLAIPGFIESHGHFAGVGGAQLQLEPDERGVVGQDRARWSPRPSRARGPGEWIYGRGWHQEKWTSRPTPNVEGFPTHASLDKVSPEQPRAARARQRPRRVRERQGDGAVGHPPADREPGGRRDPARRQRRRDGPSARAGAGADQARRGRADADAGGTEPPARARSWSWRRRKSLAKGITTFEDAGSTLATIDLMKAMVDEGKMGVRLWVMVRQANETIAPKLAQYRMIDYGNGHLTVRAIKKAIDGALGPRGAWLLAPYSDKPESSGLETTKVAEIEETARLAMQNGYQLCGARHRRPRQSRDAQHLRARVQGEPGKKDLRWRVEHAQHISARGHSAVRPDGRDRVDAGDPLHVGRALRARAARRRARAGRGLRLAEADEDRRDRRERHRRAGRGRRSDRELLRDVSRKLKDGKVFYPDQRMSRMEALKSYTMNGAYAAFEEENRGSLKPGKYADITVLSKDILKVPEDEIPTAKVVYTIVGGKVLYKGK